MSDKPLSEIAGILFPAALIHELVEIVVEGPRRSRIVRAIEENLILTELDNPRAATVGELRRQLRRNSLIDSTWRLHLRKLCNSVSEVTPPGRIICVTGSLYLIGEIRQQIIFAVGGQD